MHAKQKWTHKTFNQQNVESVSYIWTERDISHNLFDYVSLSYTTLDETKHCAQLEMEQLRYM